MLTSQVNEMKAMMTFLVKNYSEELSHDFAMFHASPVIFIKLIYILIGMLLIITIFIY